MEKINYSPFRLELLPLDLNLFFNFAVGVYIVDTRAYLNFSRLCSASESRNIMEE